MPIDVMPNPADTAPVQSAPNDSVGVLLVNLGTPDEPTTPAVRRYLRQFLSDPRVVDLPRFLWLFILNCIILVIRPSRSARAYQAIWTEEGSPLLLYSEALAKSLQTRIPADIPVELAMTYGKPSVASGIDALAAKGVTRMIVLPMYPQYSFTTTAAVYDAVDSALEKASYSMHVVRIQGYYNEEDYIAAHRDNIREFWDQNGKKNTLLMSFHGLPANSVRKGDPYFCQCKETAIQLANALELGDDDWELCFQSRVGKQKWLQPYTEDVLDELAEAGVKDLDVVSPGFSVDCLETLEEIAIGYAEDFVEAGGNALNYIPALNDSDAHAALMAGIINRYREKYT
ncbi:MAG: ferrochelatase [Pseudomonadota bacterium]